MRRVKWVSQVGEHRERVGGEGEGWELWRGSIMRGRCGVGERRGGG